MNNIQIYLEPPETSKNKTIYDDMDCKYNLIHKVSTLFKCIDCAVIFRYNFIIRTS